MEKGFLILIGTFFVVGVLHFISMRTMKLSETKKHILENSFGISMESFLC
jgi:hypothetical protein